MLAAAAPTTSAAAENDRPWIEARSPSFIVLTNAGEREARATAREFEQMQAVFRVGSPSTRLTGGRPITIVAVRDEASMKRLLPAFWEQKGRAHPAGVFLAGPAQVFVVLRTDVDDAAAVGHSVVFHEYIHYLIDLQYDSMPLWLNEGLAEFYATSTPESGRMLVGRAAPWNLRLLQQNSLLPLETLLRADAASPLYNETNRATIFYAQSWALTHYLMTGDKGSHRPRLAAYLDRVNKGEDAVEAARQVFGDLGALGRKLETYIRGMDFYMLPVATTGLAADRTYAIRTLTAAEALAVRGAVHVMMRRPREAQEALDEALRLDPGLSNAWIARAFLHSREGRMGDAENAAAAAVRTDPQSAVAFFAAGEVALHAQKPEAAEAALSRAIEINRSFAAAYVLLASARAQLRRPNDQVFPLISEALMLEPGNAGAQLTLAAILHDRGQFPAAKALGKRALLMSRTAQDRARVAAQLKGIEQQVPSDPVAAARHHATACEGGVAESCVALAHRLVRGEGVAKDAPKAVALYGKACETGNSPACRHAAQQLAFGEGIRDEAAAYGYAEKACLGNDLMGCGVQGILLGRGKGVEKDASVAVALLTRACEGKLPFYCGQLGLAFDRGDGVAPDGKRAAALYQEACSAGDAWSCDALKRVSGPPTPNPGGQSHR